MLNFSDTEEKDAIQITSNKCNQRQRSNKNDPLSCNNINQEEDDSFMKIKINLGISSKSLPEKDSDLIEKQVYTGSKNWSRCLLVMVSIRLGL